MPGQAAFYTAPSSGFKFVLNTSLSSWEDAQTNCKMNGGHLAAYSSWTEQMEVRGLAPLAAQEGAGGVLRAGAAAPDCLLPRHRQPALLLSRPQVEAYYILLGALLPSFASHKVYWMGLQSSALGWPNFDWVDPTVPDIPFIMAPPPPPPDPSGNAVDSVLAPNTYFNWGTLNLTNGSSFPEPNNLLMPLELCGGCNYTQTTNVTWPWVDANCAHKLPFMCRQTREWRPQWLRIGAAACRSAAGTR